MCENGSLANPDQYHREPNQLTMPPGQAEHASKEREALEVIKADVCQWLAALLDMKNINRDNFMQTLDNGVALCKLAGIVQKTAAEHIRDKRELDVTIPLDAVKCSSKADHGSFLARDNASNFITWCRKLGVSEAVLFESEGLVSRKDERRVILCLLDVARFGEKVGLTPPQLVRMEKEIDEEEGLVGNKAGDRSYAPAAKRVANTFEERVLQLLKNCKCAKDKLRASNYGNGKFIISGGKIRGEKSLHARLLSDRIMVRIGGGWDTLDHFLQEHDPCRIDKFISYNHGTLM